MGFIKRNAVTLVLFAFVLGIVAYRKIPTYMENRRAMEEPPARFQVQSIDGESYSLESLEGKFVVLSFWATWCMPCRAEIPILNSIYEELHDDGLVVLGITAEENAVVQDFLSERPISYPVVLDEYGSLSNRYSIQAYPTLVMIDPEGNLVDRTTGLDPLLKWKIRKHVTGSYF